MWKRELAEADANVGDSRGLFHHSSGCQRSVAEETSDQSLTVPDDYEAVLAGEPSSFWPSYDVVDRSHFLDEREPGSSSQMVRNHGIFTLAGVPSRKILPLWYLSSMMNTIDPGPISLLSSQTATMFND